MNYDKEYNPRYKNLSLLLDDIDYTIKILFKDTDSWENFAEIYDLTEEKLSLFYVATEEYILDMLEDTSKSTEEKSNDEKRGETLSQNNNA